VGYFDCDNLLCALPFGAKHTPKTAAADHFEELQIMNTNVGRFGLLQNEAI
jgi:hypothetical protein